jgi:hypothetical protein
VSCQARGATQVFYFCLVTFEKLLFISLKILMSLGSQLTLVQELKFSFVARDFIIRNRIWQSILHQAQARVKVGNNRHYHCEGTHNHKHQADATTWTYTDELSDASGQGTLRDHQGLEDIIGQRSGDQVGKG